MTKRSSGILLHITSLPSKFGIGDFGPSAYRFVDFLSKANQRFWQILPLSPTDSVFGSSPYSSHSAFAGNMLLISPRLLVDDGFLEPEDVKDVPKFSSTKVDYDIVFTYKSKLFEKAYCNYKNQSDSKEEYEKFCQANDYWLDDYCLFLLLKEIYKDDEWSSWPVQLRDRTPEALQGIRLEHSDKIEKTKFLQYIFLKQWLLLKSYCNEKGINVFGDIPIYVNYDSADVWAHPEFFKLNEKKKPLCVSGVPPDYFSEDGQRWGNPVYDWDKLKEEEYQWWKDRMSHNFMLYDMIRIDHFRGFNAFWEIPVKEKTGKNGKWVEGPSDDFFASLKEYFGELPIVAEDLGVITKDVTATMDLFGFPGMKVLLFAFGEDIKTHPYIPENFTENFIVYTGTHDNNTVQGWYKHDASKKDKDNLTKYLNRPIDPANLHWDFINMAMNSKADIAIIPMQDVLGLGKSARMNKPSTTNGNWAWRIQSKELQDSTSSQLAQISSNSKRV